MKLDENVVTIKNPGEIERLLEPCKGITYKGKWCSDMSIAGFLNRTPYCVDHFQENLDKYEKTYLNSGSVGEVDNEPAYLTKGNLDSIGFLSEKMQHMRLFSAAIYTHGNPEDLNNRDPEDILYGRRLFPS